MSTFSKVAIGSIVVSSIVLAVVLTRPGALTAFGKQPDASSRSGGVDDNSTYVPTYFPTFVPTMNGTTSPGASPTLPPMSDLSSPPPSSPADGSAVPTSYVPTAMDNGTTVPSPKPTLDLSFLMPSPPPMESTTPYPTNPVTSDGSATVSTETTGPPTAANRPTTARA
jgi:hypothetical protein